MSSRMNTSHIPDTKCASNTSVNQFNKEWFTCPLRNCQRKIPSNPYKIGNHLRLKHPFIHVTQENNDGKVYAFYCYGCKFYTKTPHSLCRECEQAEGCPSCFHSRYELNAHCRTCHTKWWYEQFCDRGLACPDKGIKCPLNHDSNPMVFYDESDKLPASVCPDDRPWSGIRCPYTICGFIHFRGRNKFIHGLLSKATIVGQKNVKSYASVTAPQPAVTSDRINMIAVAPNEIHVNLISPATDFVPPASSTPPDVAEDATLQFIESDRLFDGLPHIPNLSHLPNIPNLSHLPDLSGLPNVQWILRLQTIQNALKKYIAELREQHDKIIMSAHAPAYSSPPQDVWKQDMSSTSAHAPAYSSPPQDVWEQVMSSMSAHAPAYSSPPQDVWEQVMSFS